MTRCSTTQDCGSLHKPTFSISILYFVLGSKVKLLIFLHSVSIYNKTPVIVNINNLKTYRCPEEGLPDLSNSDYRTKTQLMEESVQNKDELTAIVGTHSVDLISVTQPVSNPKPVVHLDTSSPNPSHQLPQGANLHSISTPLLFKMARVSTRAPYQPRPRTITTPEAATILSSLTFFQFSRLHPSNLPLSA